MKRHESVPTLISFLTQLQKDRAREEIRGSIFKKKVARLKIGMAVVVELSNCLFHLSEESRNLKVTRINKKSFICDKKYKFSKKDGACLSNSQIFIKSIKKNHATSA